MKYLLLTSLALCILSGCRDEQVDLAVVKTEINQVLDSWHRAAAEGNFKQYFSFMSDSAIFMGTDRDEYWTVPEFKAYARKPFSDGAGWEFIPVERHVYVSESGEVAWFDESLKSKAFGLARGSGVLVRADKAWKIVHYNLSLPIPNSIVYEVVNRIQAIPEGSVKIKQ